MISPSPLYNDSGHKLRALILQLREALGHQQSLNALISTAPPAHGSFMPVLDGTLSVAHEMEPLHGAPRAVHHIGTQTIVATAIPESSPGQYSTLCIIEIPALMYD